MTTLIAWVLALGILPSLTALTGAHRFLGPMNFLKLAAPLLLFFLWQRRQEIPRRVTFWLGSAFVVGTLATVIASIRCGELSPAFLREWMVMSLGCVAAVCLSLLPPRLASRVLVFWGVAVFGTALLDFISPSSVDWLLAHLFDPDTRKWDVPEIGRPVLGGIFGRQSMAKLLSWLPWLFVIRFGEKKNALPLLALLFVFATASTLATSQRGPFAAALAAGVIFTLHQAIRLGNRKLALACAGGLGLTVALTFTIVPRAVWEPRLRSVFGVTDQVSTWEQKVANGNKKFRLEMSLFSIKWIGTHPLGDACIPEQAFRDAGVPAHHSHSLLLEQYRSRGWVFGTLHLVLWILTFWAGWRTRTIEGGALAAGTAAILLGGLVDHPWFVLNHAMVLGLYFVVGLSMRRAQTS